ncbi:MAG: helix-turn-helix transcriptional regulator, partial [Oscillospiraceae bacterium]|nr:helix-turn-helix transcriptional regulator [Oscillospiraceae bacterium]
ARLEECRRTWHLPKESLICIRAGQTPTLFALNKPLAFAGLLAEGESCPLPTSAAPSVFVPKSSSTVFADFSRMLCQLPCPQESQILQSLLNALQREMQPLLPDGMLPPASIQLLHQILETRYAERLTLDSLSKELHWNKYKLDKDFKVYYGLSPFEYLLSVRVQEACHLLRTTNRSVLDIGLAVGVENASYFIRLFKSRMGMSPLAYRAHFSSQEEQKKSV